MSGTAVLTGIQGNRGDHVKQRDVFAALEGDAPIHKSIRGFGPGPQDGPVDFATLCEMKSEPQTLRALEKSPRWDVVDGGNGVVLVINTATIGVEWINIIPLLPAKKRMGIYNSKKSAVGALCLHEPSGRFAWLYGLHNIHSLWMPGRRAAGLEHNEKFVAEASKHRALTIAGMDANAQWGDRSMKPFRERGWEHAALLGTHKKPRYNRAIDIWAYQDKADPIVVGRPSPQLVEVKGTDHLWYRVAFELEVRGKR